MEWRIDDSPIDYGAALGVMDARARDIRAGTAPELAWLLEHPSLYTAGTSAKSGDLLAPSRFPVYRSGRGGQYTYHGPGQRIRHWVTMHGVALNHEPALEHFTGIVPCGIQGPQYGVTSLHDLGILVS